MTDERSPFNNWRRYLKLQMSDWDTSIQGILIEEHDGRRFAVEPVEIRLKEVHGYECFTPTFTVSRESAQSVIDELYRIGLRPTEAQDSAGELKATKYHLEDMRHLVLDHQFQNSREVKEGA